MALFGTNDKLALEIVVVLAALAFGAGLGMLGVASVRRRGAGVRGVRGRSGSLAALGDPLANPGDRRAPGRRVGGARGPGAVVAAGVGRRARGIGRRVRRPARPRTRRAARSSCGPAPSACPRSSRASAAGACSTGRGRRRSPTADLPPAVGDRAAAGEPAPTSRRRRPGLTPIVVPNDRFYRIDTALLVPERRRRDLDPADPRPRGARDDPDLGRAAGPAHVRAVRDDRLRQQRGRRRPGREREVDRRPAARRARHRRGLVVGHASSSVGRSTGSPPACRRPGSWTRRASR